MVITGANTQISKAARNVVLRHPNAFDIVLYRKTVERDSPALLGGALVLSSEDEPDFDYDELGNGRIVFVDQYAGMTAFSDSQTVADYGAPTFNALIQPIAATDEEDGHFTPQKSDVLYVHVGMGIALAFEITGIPGTMGLSPMGVKYELTKRDDLTYAGLATDG